MKKIFIIFVSYLFTLCTFADGYGGGGIGYTEPCHTKYEAGFAGGDCIDPNLNVRGFIGNELNDYFALEGAVDFSFDGGEIFNSFLNAILNDATDGAVSTGGGGSQYDRVNRRSILTLSLNGLFYLPITNSVKLFAGPSIGGSMVDLKYKASYFGDNISNDRSETKFSTNYGWTAGIDFKNKANTTIRIQWQNWRALESEISDYGKFNSNTFTVNIYQYF